MRCLRLYILIGLLLTGGAAGTEPISTELGYANFITLSADFLPEGISISSIGQLQDGRMVWGGDQLWIQDGTRSESISLPPDSGRIRIVNEAINGRILITGNTFIGITENDPTSGWQLQGWSKIRESVTAFRSNQYRLVERGGTPIVVDDADGAWFDGQRWHSWDRLDTGSDEDRPINSYWLTNRGVLRMHDFVNLQRWVDGAWQFDRQLSSELVDVMPPIYEDPSGDLTVAHFDGGLSRISPEGESVSLVRATPDRVGSSRITWFDDGAAVVSATESSIRIQDPQGRGLARVGPINGLRASEIDTTFIDRSRRVWLGANDRVMLLELPEHLTRFDRSNGLETSAVSTLVRHEGQLYAGTNGGVFRLLPGSGQDIHQPARFERVPGINSHTPTLLLHDGRLLAGHADGVSQLGSDGFDLIAPTVSPVSTIVTSKFAPHRVTIATTGGVRNLQHSDDGWNWAEENFTKGDHREIMELAPQVWLKVLGEGDLVRSEITEMVSPKVDSSEDFLTMAPLLKPLFGRDFRPTSYALRGVSGTPLNHFSLIRWGDTPLIVTEEGLFSTEVTPQPVSLLDAETQRSLPQDRHLHLLVPSSPTRAWLALAPSREAARQGLGWQIREVNRAGSAPRRILPHATTEVGTINALFSEMTPDGEEVLWVGGERGLLRVRLDDLPSPAAPSAPKLHTTPTLVDQDEVPTVPDGHPLITFRFSTDDNIANPPAYRSRLQLDGVGDWTPFYPDAHLEFNFPGAGDYHLEVQARNADGLTSEISSLHFTVPPPWWLRPWAMVLGGLLLLGLLIGVSRARSAQLRRRQHELEALVDERTAELKEREHQFLDAKNQAESANQAKSTFLASMSHELRTPLNAILGFAQIVRREKDLSPKGRRQLETIGRNGKHLLEMINEVLDLSKIEANKMQLNPAPCSMRRLATGLAETFEQRASEKGLTFRLEFGAGVPRRVIVDEAKLQQVLINLLANAVKFTEQGEVLLAFAFVDGHCHFSIRDTGPGIAPTEQGSVFEPFHQVTPDGTSFASPGTGLGLPISQRIVELMGSRITLESELGSGSCFRFELKLPLVAAPASTEAPTQIIGYEGPRRRLLVVDDVTTNRAVLHDLLSLLDFKIEEASNGADALAAHAAHPFDLILLDLHLPDRDGSEIARDFRVDPHRPRLVAVTASVFGTDGDLVQQSGCDAFVPKPVDESTLLDAIAQQLSLSWTTAAAQAVETDGNSSPGFDLLSLPLPSLTEVEACLDLARHADLQGLRNRIEQTPADAPGAEFRQEIAGLAKRFRTGAIRDILVRALQRIQSAPPSSDP